jgi:predicted AlkP superfamily pyrophosphatase or phosphodiesterase
MRRPIPGILALFVLALSVMAAAPPKRPKLVLAIIIDQFRYDYLLKFRSEYNSGLERLLEQGAVFTDAQYLHATTVTAVGHSTFLTGAPPSVSGIVANDWWDREAKLKITSVVDKNAKLVGGFAGVMGSSPHRLLVSTVPDEIKLAGIPSKSISVSIKDRSAILPIGRMGDAAYWYDGDQYRWVTSDYYRKDLPEWAKAINARETYKQYTTASWLPFDATSPSAKPFCSMLPDGQPRFCGSLDATPWGNEMIEEFAEKALDEEQLGRHAGVDVLAVSFSSNDYVGHAVGPDDPAVRDITLRTDRLLGKFLQFVDEKVGAGNTLLVLSADHGVAQVPEAHKTAAGGRIDSLRLDKRIREALAQRFGPGEWIVGGSANMPYLNLDLIRTRKLNPSDVENVVAETALSEPHIARVYTRHQLMEGLVPNDEIGRAFLLSFYAPRSGDVMILQEPGYLFEATGTSHGTPYHYDTHVPVIFMGPGVKPGTYRGRIAPNDIAPTLSSMLGIQEPSGSIGRVLREMLE